MVQVLADWRSDAVPVHLVYPQNRHLSAKVRVFVEWVAELFAANPYMHMGAMPRVQAAPAPLLVPLTA
jgi:LysR family transcriptional regulator for bpeEF and oprC